MNCKGVFTSMCRIIFRHAMIFLAIFLLCLVFTSCQQVQQTKDFITSKFSSDKEIDKVIEVVNEFFNMLMEKSKVKRRTPEEGWKRFKIMKNDVMVIRCQSVKRNTNPPVQCGHSAQKA